MWSARCRVHGRPSCWSARRRRESNARVYPRHFPIAVHEASRQLRARRRRQRVHRLPDRRRRAVARAQPPRAGRGGRDRAARPVHATGWTCRPRRRTRSSRRSCRCCPGRDGRAHEGALLRPDRGERRRRRDQAVQDRDRARRRGLVPGRLPRHHARRDGADRAGRATRRPVANGVPGVHFFPYSYCADCPLGLHPGQLRDQLRRVPGAVAARPERRRPAAGRGDPGAGAGRGRGRSRPTRTSCAGCAR